MKTKDNNPSSRGSSYELYDRLSEQMTDLMQSQVSNIKQLTNLIWLATCIINGETISLGKLVTYLAGDALASSRVTRIRRWLMNPHVDVWQLYEPLLKHILKDWQAKTVSVILDGSMVFGDRLQIFRLSLAHGNRAIPLWWVVLPGKGLVKSEKLSELFTRVAKFLNPYAEQVLFLADCGFRSYDWVELCQSVGWQYRIRIARSTHIHLRTGRTVRLDALTIKRGRIVCFNTVRLTLTRQFVTHVSITWSRGDANTDPELVIVVSDQRASPDRLREYAVRMDIEQSFKDDKSAGFDIDHTRLQHPERLERLLLAVAIATIWCHELGEFVLQQGESARRLIDPGFTRALSLFQLGLRWLKHALAVLLDSLPPFQAILSNIDLPPVGVKV